MEFSCTRDCGGLCRIVQGIAPNYSVLCIVFTAAVLEMNCWYASTCPAKQFHLFQRLFINFLKEFLPSWLYPKKSCTSPMGQHPNTRIGRISSTYGVKAEWHFLATSHGKGACDGLGGIVKWLAAQASLQRPYNIVANFPKLKTGVDHTHRHTH